MLVRVKIYGKKRYHCHKRSKYQNNLMKSNIPGGFSIYECGHLVFASVDLKQKWKVLKINAN